MNDIKFSTKLMEEEGFVLTLHTTRKGINVKTEMALQYPINGTPHLLKRIDSCYQYVTTLKEFMAAGQHIHTYLKYATHYMGEKSAKIVAKLQSLLHEACISGHLEGRLKVHNAKTRHTYPLLPEFSRPKENEIEFKVYNDMGIEIDLTFHTRPSGRIFHYVTIRDDNSVSQHDRDMPFTRPDIINNFIVKSIHGHFKDTNPDVEVIKEIVEEVNAFFSSSHNAFLELIFKMNNKKPL